MYTRLDDIPVLELREGQISALYYNHAQVAHKRLGASLRFQIPKLRHLDLIVEPNAWIIVDRALNDVPVAAWTDFASQHRTNLHQPITCRIKLYHANAQMILDRTLDAMELLLGEQLTDIENQDDCRVLPFPGSCVPHTSS